MEETKRWSEGVVGFGKETSVDDLLAKMRQELDSLGPPADDLLTRMRQELDTGRALTDIDVGDAHADRGVSGVSGVGQVRLNRKQRRAAARAKARGRR